MRSRIVLSVVGVLVLAVAFGVFDARLQGVGSDPTRLWISNMSAAYLILAFVAGRVVARRRFGAVLGVALGLVATVTALTSFYAWQVAENHFTAVLAVTQLSRYVAGGVFSGPLFGWFGHRWGLRRSWYAATAVVTALVLEPYAWRAHLGFTPSPGWVWTAEQLVGVAAAAFFVLETVRYHRDGRRLGALRPREASVTWTHQS